YPPCGSAVARRQRLDRLGNLPPGQPTHLGDYPREFLKVGVEDFGGMFRMSHCGGINPSRGTRRKKPFYDGFAVGAMTVKGGTEICGHASKGSPATDNLHYPPATAEDWVSHPLP